MTRLIFVHGRAKENKDPSALKAEWMESLRVGAANAAISLELNDDDAKFVYYGQTLFDSVEGKSESEIAEVIVKGLERANDSAFRSLLYEIASHAGISKGDLQREEDTPYLEKGVLNSQMVQAVLRLIDRKVPFASGVAVAAFTYDVYLYTTDPKVRRRTEDGIRHALLDAGSAVVVSHSLGSIVAYNVLRDTQMTKLFKAPQFVTLGSPLGIEYVRNWLAPTRWPSCVDAWFNARDPLDVVALYPLLPPNFDVTRPIDAKDDVINLTENRHGISGYLSDPDVAGCICRALRGL